MIPRPLLRAAGGVAAAVALLIAASMMNDRGLIEVDDVLAIGRQWVPTRTPAQASQATICIPTAGALSGLVAIQDINAALGAMLSSNSGGSAPANDCTAAAVRGQFWLDTANNLLKFFDGTSWQVVGYTDPSTHVWTPPVGGGLATLARAATVDLCSVRQNFVVLTGTTTITSFGNVCPDGVMKALYFSGVGGLTDNANINMGGVSRTTAAGDRAIIVFWAGTAMVQNYTPASGVGTVTEDKITAGTGLAASGNCDNTSTNLGSPCNLALAQTNVTLQASPTLPGASGSTTGVMSGFGAACHLTPTYGARVFVTIQGTAQANSNNIVTLDFRYGTGSAPSAGAAFTGTQVGSSLAVQNTGGGLNLPFALHAVITGLSPGTAYWFDVNEKVNTGNNQFFTASCDGFEF